MAQKRYIVSDTPKFNKTSDGVSIQQIARVKVGNGDTNKARQSRPVMFTGRTVHYATPVRSVEDQLHNQTFDRPVWEI